VTMPTATVADVPVSYSDQGEGRPFLLLHGGAGPRSVAAFADLLATTEPARVLMPIHPGFDGTPRPAGLHTMAGLAAVYTGLLDELDLTDVTVIGNSIGGWIAAEIALRRSPRISSVILVDAAGLAIEEQPIADFFALTMDEVADLSYYRPDDFRIDVDAMPDAAKAAMAANRQTLQTYAGTAMADPELRDRLRHVTTPTLVVWGAADRVVPLVHGEAYATGIPGARLEVIADAGHLPQLETPAELLPLVWQFAAEHAVTAS
jgi:pimeloyl-ACP methyl ester carboxylesterase